MNRPPSRPLTLEEKMRRDFGPPPPPRSVWDIWATALTRPNLQAYTEIARSRDADAGTAYLWIVIMGVGGIILSGLFQMFVVLVEPDILREQLNQQQAQNPSSSFIYEMFSDQSTIWLLYFIGFGFALLCYPALYTISYGFYTGGIQLMSSILGGENNYSALCYTLAAFIAPLLMISSLVQGLLSWVNLLIWMLLGSGYGWIVSISQWPFTALIYVYGFILSVLAIKASQNLDWVASIVAAAFPFTIYIFILACCFFGSIGSIIGASTF